VLVEYKGVLLSIFCNYMKNKINNFITITSKAITIIMKGENHEKTAH